MKRVWVTFVSALLLVAVGAGGYLIGTRQTRLISEPQKDLAEPPDSPPSSPMQTEEAVTMNTKELPSISAALVAYLVEQRGIRRPIISFETNDGTYATGQYNEVEAVGGARWYAAKIGGQWSIVYVGQAPPRCQEIAHYHLPKEFLDCY